MSLAFGRIVASRTPILPPRKGILVPRHARPTHLIRGSRLRDVESSLRTYHAGGRGRNVRVTRHLDASFAALPDLAAHLPDHHLPSRAVRAIAERAKSPSTIADWVDDLVNEYKRLVERVSRCRDSLAHGGPINLETAATVRQFAYQQATVTTSIGLWALLTGGNVKDAHATRREEEEHWRSELASASTVAAILPPPPSEPNS